jgi:hypothetical protein
VTLAALTLAVIGATAQSSGLRRPAIGRCRDIAMEMRSQRAMHELGRVLEALTEWRTWLSVRALTDAFRSANQPARALMLGYLGRC